MSDTVEIDLTYAISEIQDIQGELEVNNDAHGHLSARLEGVEVRLKELADTLYEYLGDAPTNPTSAAVTARRRIFDT